MLAVEEVAPLMFVPLLGFHLWLVQRHGNALPPSEEAKPESQRHSIPFFPDFFSRDLGMWLIALNLLAALASVGEQQSRTGEQLALRRKRLEDLQLELARPFEHEVRLTTLLVRQRELLKQLDLDKDEAGNASLDGEAMRQAA